MRRVQLYVTQPCLHTLMQTRLSGNQSARTILVILEYLIFILRIFYKNDQMRITDITINLKPIYNYNEIKMTKTKLFTIRKVIS